MDGQVLNISPIVLWVGALSQLLNFGLSIFGLIMSGSRSNAKKIDGHATRLENLDQRMSSVEQTTRSLPAPKDLHELELSIEKLQGRIETMSAVMSGHVAIMERLEAIVSRHENHLLDGKGR